METEKTLTERIMAITHEINRQHPELTKYLTEMPDTNPKEKDPNTNKKALREYYDSLIELVRKYLPNHILQEKENNKNNSLDKI